METVLLCIVAVAILIVLFTKLYFMHLGVENVIAKKDSRSAFVVDEQTEDSLTFSTNVEFVNEGKQCAVVMDCFVRPQLPYEQYDGVETRGHAELLSAPREDDYFEAYIIQRKGYGKDLDRTTIKAQIKLIARHGMTIKEAISKMPDFNFLIIWMESGRMEAHYRQVRIEVPAAEIAKLVGTELVEA